MFGKKEDFVVKINSILGTGSEIQGNFTSTGSLRVDGIVYGDVKITGHLIVGTGGRIFGSAEAETAVIGGEVHGNVTAPSMAEFTETATVMGDVTTKDFVKEEGAKILGRCNVYEDTADGKRKLVIPKSVKPSDRVARRTAKEALQDAFRDTESQKITEE